MHLVWDDTHSGSTQYYIVYIHTGILHICHALFFGMRFVVDVCFLCVPLGKVLMHYIRCRIWIKHPGEDH
jgi:hypothetical protein